MDPTAPLIIHMHFRAVEPATSRPDFVRAFRIGRQDGQYLPELMCTTQDAGVPDAPMPRFPLRAASSAGQAMASVLAQVPVGYRVDLIEPEYTDAAWEDVVTDNARLSLPGVRVRMPWQRGPVMA